MKKSIHNKIKTVQFGVIAVVFIVVPLFFGTKEDMELNGLFILLALFFGFLCYKYSKKINEQGDTMDDYKPADDASEVDKIAFYKRMLYLSLLAFPALTYLVVDDINSFESHTQDYLSLWWPVAFAYKQFGYWAGVLFAPVLGLICIVGFFIKIRKIKWEYNKNNNTLIKRY